MEKSTNASEPNDDETKEIVGLLDNVFSWSLQDLMNENLYKYKVKKIPETFDSPTDTDLSSKFVRPKSVDDLNLNMANSPYHIAFVLGPTPISELTDVTIRLHSLVSDSLEHDTYGLGDIVLFGNKTGWKKSLELMKLLLRDPQEQYLFEICAYRAYKQDIGNEAWKKIAGSNLNG
ncbi:hypothetical protein TSUD_214100 [Trifolium subterraneum]|uniref:Uncharacterized protein n=1 Tax=Trifolium subterraneum TaxID=3900 RepID=A0A2Z6N827_TRISU|nr:hypothetical protein TSUD_214100 [Trifolium subterraneum]